MDIIALCPFSYQRSKPRQADACQRRRRESARTRRENPSAPIGRARVFACYEQYTRGPLSGKEWFQSNWRRCDLKSRARVALVWIGAEVARRTVGDSSADPR